MKIKFSMREKLYAAVKFEVECENKEQLEEALDEIGEDLSADDMELRLMHIFGSENVKSEGVNSVDNIQSADECEFWDWEDL